MLPEQNVYIYGATSFEAINRSRGKACRRAFRVFGASRGVQQSTRPQREHCSETIKARPVTFVRDGGKGRRSLIRREHRLARLRASVASRRSCKTSAISADNLWRLLFSRGPGRKNRETERRWCDEEARGEGGRERERAHGWVRGNGGVVKRSPVNQIYRRFLSYKAV